jgi:CheY-like chemotaxis protein
MTAKHCPEDAERALAHGAYAYLVKPMPAEDLLDHVTAALAARPSLRSPESRASCDHPSAG